MAYTPISDDEALELVKKRRARMERRHKERIPVYDHRYRAWTGVLEREHDIWEHNLSPKYAFQKLDVLMSYLWGDAPAGRALPVGARDVDAAKCMTKLLREGNRRQEFDSVSYAFAMQALVMGVTFAKVGWAYEEHREEVPQYAPAMGGGQEQVGTSEKLTILKDNPSFYPVPVQDFMWDPSAVRWQDTADCIFLIPKSLESLKDLERQGVYHNIAEVAQTRAAPGYGQSAQRAPQGYITLDKQGKIEVAEYWTRDRLITVANQRVVIRNEASPHTHHRLPFVCATTLPDLYGIGGFSEIELIAHLQAILWESLNQHLDNASLSNNAVFFYEESLTDEEQVGIFPGAFIPGAGVTPWAPNPQVQIQSVNLMKEIKGDIDDIIGAGPYLSGSNLDQTDAQTATQIATFQSAAARRVAKKRALLYLAYRDKGYQDIRNYQQFMDKPLEIRMEGDAPDPDGDPSYKWDIVEPQQIADADFEYDLQVDAEAADKQSRRLMAQQLISSTALLAPLVPVAQMLGLNLPTYARYLLESYDVPNVDQFVAPQQAPTDVPPENPGSLGGAGQETPLPPTLGGGGGQVAPATPARAGAGGPGPSLPTPGTPGGP